MCRFSLNIVFVRIQNMRAMMALDCSPESFSPQNEFDLLRSSVPTCVPRGGATFDPQDMKWTNLTEVQMEMLNTKYQSSTPSSFREEEFWRMSSSVPWSNLRPPPKPPSPGCGHFWPQRHHMKNLVEVHKEYAAYQISKFHTFQFQRRISIDWMVFYTAFNSISVILRRQFTLFMLSWVSPVLS